MKRVLAFSGIALLLIILVSCTQKQSSVNGSGSNDSTLMALNEALKDDPKNVAMYIQRAEYYIDHQKLNDALSDLNKALELDPKNVKGLVVLSNIYVLMGKPQQSLDALNKAISYDPANIDAYLKKAKLYLVMKDYNNCAASVVKVLELDPHNADAYYLKGVTLDENGETRKSIESFQQAVLYNPKHYDALMQLGYAFSETKPDMAMDYFRNALKSDSTSLEALYNLGMLYQENGFPEKALETYATMLRFDGKNKLALYNSGYVNLVYLHKYQASTDFFTKAIASDTAYADAYYNRAYSFELLGDESKARNDYEKVLKLRVNDPKAAEGLSRLDKMRKK